MLPDPAVLPLGAPAGTSLSYIPPVHGVGQAAGAGINTHALAIGAGCTPVLPWPLQPAPSHALCAHAVQFRDVCLVAGHKG